MSAPRAANTPGSDTAAAATLPRAPWREVGLVALVAALDALVRLGRLHPDEVFQTLEPALVKAFGYGVVAWEWEVGLRNWAVPGLFALLLKAGAAVGVADPFARRVLLEVPQLALHAAMLAAVYRLAARRVEPLAARLSVLLVGLYAPVVWFGGRTMSESFSTAFLVWGLERLDARDRRLWPALLGGALLGFAEVTRYGSAAAILPAMLWLLLSRRFRDFALAAGGGLLVALALGLLDRLTWGGWWHSLHRYLDFNVLSGQAAARFGASPWHEYANSFLLAPWAAVGFFLWFWRKATRGWLLVAAGVGYLGIVSATPHKEPRFLYPALVLLCVAAAPAFAQWAVQVLSRREGALAHVRAGLVALPVVAAALFFFVPTPFDVERPQQFQLTLRAGRGATGLVLMNEGVWGSGGYFYLGKQIPWFPALGPCEFPESPCFGAAARDGVFNRALYWEGPGEAERTQRTTAAFQQIGFRLVERRGQAFLFERP